MIYWLGTTADFAVLYDVWSAAVVAVHLQLFSVEGFAVFPASAAETTAAAAAPAAAAAADAAASVAYKGRRVSRIIANNFPSWNKAKSCEDANVVLSHPPDH